MSNIIFQSSADLSTGKVQMQKGSGQGLSARSTNIVTNPAPKGKSGKRKHAQIMPSYMRPTKSFVPKQQSKTVDQSKCKKQRVKKTRLTVPESPALRSKVRSISRVQKAQAREVQRQERETEQRKLEKVRNMKIMKKALLPKPTTGTVRSHKGLTLPVEFNLETAQRPRAIEKNALNSAPPAQNKIDTTAALTQPQPFNLQTSARAKMHTSLHSAEPFKSTVQMMDEFHHKTPPRYHSKPKAQEVPVLPPALNATLTVPAAPTFNASSREAVRGTTEFEPMCVKVAKFHSNTPERFHTVPAGSKPVLPSPVASTLTNAVSPSFKTDERAALKPAPLSSEDLTIQYMNENKFKANPVNYNALNSCGDLGVPKLVSKESTVCEPFLISQTNKAPPVMQEEENVAPFKAQSVNKEMLQRPMFIPKPSDKELTEAHSPVFQTAVRAAAHKSTCATVEMDTQFVAKPMPDMTYPTFVPQPSAKPLTEAEPFNLVSEDLHTNAQAAFQERLDVEQQEAHEKREFKARPIVHHFPEHATKPAVERPLTEVEPFHFEGDSHSHEAQRSMQQHLAVQEQMAADAAKFKARPMPNMSKKFEVTASEKELTTATAPELGTQVRAEQRAEFDEHNQERIAAVEAQLEGAARDRAMREQEEIKNLRKNMNFKAQPIFKGRKVQVKKSTKPLTVSQSPSFGSRKKMRRC